MKELNTPDQDLRTALHFACMSKKGASIAFALLKKGVDIDKLDKRLRLPLHYTCENGLTEVAEEMISKLKSVPIENTKPPVSNQSM